jgi:hypothetical protein
MTMRTSTRTFVYGAALAAVLGGCATQAPQAPGWKPVPVGTTWSVMQRNTGSYGRDVQLTVTRVPDIDWKGSPAVVMKTSTGGMLVQQPSDGRWLAMLAPDGKPAVTFEPAAGWSPPLALGTSFKRPQKVTNHVTGRTAEYEWGCTVPAVEKITVPAGTFDALRVECTSSLDAQDTYWVAANVNPFLKTRLVRGPKNPAGPGTQETELLKLPS